MKKSLLVVSFFVVLIVTFGGSFVAEASVFYQNGFETETTGALPAGWSNIGTSDWKVGTTDPVSGSKSFGEPSYSSTDINVFTGTTATANSSGQISQIVHVDGSNNGATTGLFLRTSADMQNGYLFTPQFGSTFSAGYIFKRVNGSYSVLNSSSAGQIFANNDIVLLKAEVSGTTLRWKMWKSTQSEPGSWTVSITDSSISSPGYIGLFSGVNSGGSNASTTSNIDNIYWGDVGQTYGGFSAGSIVLGSKTSTTVNLTSTGGMGGTAPYTYQWYRSASSGFTPGPANILSDQTSTTLNDTGLTASTTYYYKLRVTDNGSATADSNEFSVTTNGLATSYTLTGPSSGMANNASSNFTVTPNGDYTGTVTPTTTGSGTFTPASLTWTSSSIPETFTYTPNTTTGSPHSISPCWRKLGSTALCRGYACACTKKGFKLLPLR